MKIDTEKKIVLTLDAGGTNLKFSAISGREILFDPIYIPTQPNDLEECLDRIVSGFRAVLERLPTPPFAISFAFPGPADYPRGIIGDLQNLPAFRGGVALGPFLEETFSLPVFINNDGDLFAYGEALAGFLPEVNRALEEAGNPTRYHNLLGVTFGTGFGGGIISGGILHRGDNSIGGEICLLRNKLHPDWCAEEGCCIRAVRRTYAALTDSPPELAPDPKEIYQIACGERVGNRDAALEAYRQFGEIAGDAIAQALTLTDSLVVFGGGLSAAAPAFLPALLASANSSYQNPDGPYRKLIQHLYSFDDPAQRHAFLHPAVRQIRIPKSDRTISYYPDAKTAIGISRLGTSQAVATGAYAFALAHG